MGHAISTTHQQTTSTKADESVGPVRPIATAGVYCRSVTNYSRGSLSQTFYAGFVRLGAFSDTRGSLKFFVEPLLESEVPLPPQIRALQEDCSKQNDYLSFSTDTITQHNSYMLHHTELDDLVCFFVFPSLARRIYPSPCKNQRKPPKKSAGT